MSDTHLFGAIDHPKAAREIVDLPSVRWALQLGIDRVKALHNGAAGAIEHGAQEFMREKVIAALESMREETKL